MPLKDVYKDSNRMIRSLGDHLLTLEVVDVEVDVDVDVVQVMLVGGLIEVVVTGVYEVDLDGV